MTNGTLSKQIGTKYRNKHIAITTDNRLGKRALCLVSPILVIDIEKNRAGKKCIYK